MEYEEVNYWEELKTVMEWSRSHVTSTMHLCWGAQAGLYYHYGIPKYKREEKLLGHLHPQDSGPEGPPDAELRRYLSLPPFPIH